MADCLFCRIATKSIPSKLVHEDELTLAFEDINPQAPVHLLIIPRKHIASLNEITDEDRPALGALLSVARRLAGERGIDGSGYRIVLNTLAGAGQSVFHVHAHLLGGRTFSWPPG